MKKKTKRFLEENNRAEALLSPAHQNLMTDIVVYLRGSAIRVWEQETVRRDIIQMLADAEQRGEKAETVIGTDLKRFCDSVIAEMPKMPRKQAWAVSVRDILPGTIILMLIWLVTGAAESFVRNGSITTVSLSLGQLLSGVGILLAACGIVYRICRNPFTADSRKAEWAVLFVIMFLLFSLSFFLKQIVAVIPVWAAICTMAAVYLLYRMLDAALDD